MSVSSTGLPEPRPSRRRIRFGFVLTPWFQRGLLALVVSSVVSFLMIEYVPLPSQTLKEGDIAEHNVRATQSFEFTDADATGQRRDAAERAVRPVFDLDADRAATTIARVHRAFAGIRAQLELDQPVRRAELTEVAGAESAAGTSSRNGGQGDGQATGAEGKGKKAGDAALEALSTPEKRREFYDALGIEVLDVFYQNLVYLRFSPAIEEAICSVIDRTMKDLIIAEKSVLPDDMGANGVTVSKLGRDAHDERLLYDREQILDLAEARRRVGGLTRELYSEHPQFHRDTIVAVAQRLVRPTLSYNASATALRKQQARTNVPPVVYQIKKGTMVVRAGDPIDGQKLMFLQAIAQAKAEYHAGRMFGAVALLVLLLLTSSYMFASHYIRKFSTSVKDLVTASIILVFAIALTRVSVEISNALAAYIPTIPLTSYYYAIPLACGAMVVRILMNSETALVFAVVVSALAALLVDYNVFFLSYFFVSSLAAAGGIAHTKERVHVLRGGLVAAGCNILSVIAVFLIQTNMVDSRIGAEADQLPYHVAFALLGGVGSAILALGVVPFFEMFGYVTDYKLLELANLNHPLLKELMVRAPGTYHHSVIVGNLSEAAAQAIKANALLARVGCYYHDIGKMRKPDHFIENLRNVNENKHDRLPPHMSALIIAGHVRDGIEMGRQHRLPPAIIDLIPQHHGTALISFFYNKAKSSAADSESVDENDFRYPGPRPQTREAGIVMLADATEASTRSIKQVNAAKIRMNLQKIFQRVINDGQLDECPLTLKDLAVILETFHRTLLGIYHNRIEYPAEYRGATVAGEGTGAVLTLETDGGLAAAPRSSRTSLPPTPRRVLAEDLMSTTTADPLPVAAPANGGSSPNAIPDEEPRAPLEQPPVRS